MRFAALLMVLLLAWLPQAALAEDANAAADQQFIDGLRQRHLYRLAQTFCLEQLARSDLDDEARAQFVIQLSRSFAEQALHTKPGERDPLWKQAATVTEKFVNEHPESTSWPLVRMQTALVYLAHGESIRRRIELSSNPGDLPDQALESLQFAIKITNQLDQFLASRLRAAARPASKPKQGLNENELRWLQIQCQFYHAQASMNLGELYPIGSPDRVAALRSAIDRFDPLAKLDDSQPLAWQSRIETAACYRLMGNFAEAGRQLQRWDSSTPPAKVQTELQTEWLMLELAQDNLSAAVQRIKQHENGDWIRTPLWDEAVIQVFLATAKASSENGEAAQATAWRARAMERLPAIARHGLFWKRRGETLLARSASPNAQSPGELSTLARAADGFYRSGELDEAIAAYDRASAAASAQESVDQFFDLSRKAAAIELKRKNYSEAAKRLRALALAAPKHPGAADAHLLAVYYCGQAAQQQKPIVLDEYVAWIDEHLRMWPEADSANQARWWQARVLKEQAEWERAIAALMGISPDHKQFIPALNEIAACYEGRIAAEANSNEDISPLAAEATQWLQRLVVGTENRWPERWSPSQLEAALLASRFFIAYGGDYAKAETMLGQAMSQSENATESWSTTASGLLAVALAGQGRADEAVPLMQQLVAGTPEQRLRLLVDLERVGTGNATPPAELTSIRLKLAETLEADQHTLSPDQRREWQLAWARTLSAAGDVDEAARRYAALIDSQETDPAAQYEYAQLLARSEDRASLEQALTLWRDVLNELSRTDPQGQQWFEAKYQLALLHFKLGDPQRAAKIIRLTQVLHPELGNPSLKAQFQDLLARCEGTSTQ